MHQRAADGICGDLSGQRRDITGDFCPKNAVGLGLK